MLQVTKRLGTYTTKLRTYTPQSVHSKFSVKFLTISPNSLTSYTKTIARTFFLKRRCPDDIKTKINQEINDLESRAKELYQKGDYSLSILYYLSLIRVGRFSFWKSDFSSLLLRVSFAMSRMNKPKHAIRLVNESIKARVSAYGKSHFQVAVAICCSVYIYMYFKLYDHAILSINEALYIYELYENNPRKDGLPDMEKTVALEKAKMISSRATCHFHLGNVSAAKNDWISTIQSMVQYITQDSIPDVLVGAYMNLINLSKKTNDLRSSLFYCKELIDLCESYHPNSKYLPMAFRTMARLYLRCQNFELATYYFEKALESTVKILGKGQEYEVLSYALEQTRIKAQYANPSQYKKLS